MAIALGVASLALGAYSAYQGGQQASAAANAQDNASIRQANVQREANRESIAFQKEQARIARADQAPWRKAGQKALGQLQANLKAGPGEFDPTQDPGYKFGYDQMSKGLSRRAAAGGRRTGGGALKELSRYSQDYASTKYDDFLRRFYDKQRPLQSLAGVGQTASNVSGSQAMQLGGNVGNTLMAGGQAQANAFGQMGDAQSYNALAQGQMYQNYANIGSNALAFGAGAYGSSPTTPNHPAAYGYGGPR